MYYNISEVINVVNFFQMVNETLLNGMMGIAFLSVIFIIVFLSMKHRKPEEAFMGSMFTTVMASMFFMIFGIIPGYVVITLVLMMIFSIFIMWRKEV